MGISEIIIAALISASVSLVGLYLGRKKDDAEASEKISSAWEKLIAPYEIRITKLETENRQLWEYIGVLKRELEKHNIPIPAMPDVSKKDNQV